MTTSTAKAENKSPASGVRNFRNIAEIENFYRFVYENDLRREATMVLSSICDVIIEKKSKRKRRKKKLQ